jgi:hypothetical protein
MIRTKSTSISHQEHEGSCAIHASTRLIVNAIRQIIPEFFYPLENNDKCDEYFYISKMRDIFIEDTNCSENGFNNLLMYVYIYTISANSFGTKRANIISIYSDFNNDIIKRIGNEDFILKILNTFPGFNNGHLERLTHICNTFLHRLFVEQNTHFNVETYILDEDMDESLLRFVLDNGYYITVQGNSHVLTIVGYEILDDKFYFIIKNSWGKKTGDISLFSNFIMTMNQGIIKLTVKELIESKYTYIQFMIPNVIDESEIRMIENGERMERLRLDLVDAERRQKYKESRKGGKKSKKSKKYRKHRKSKKLFH